MISVRQCYAYKASVFVCTIMIVAGLLGVTQLQAQKLKVLRFVTEETDPDSLKVYRQQIEEYESTHPNVKILLEPSPTDEPTMILYAQLAAGTAPDISTLNALDILGLAVEGLLLPVEDVIEDIGTGEFSPQGFVYEEGHIWNLPYAIDANVLWVRTDLMKQYGVKAPDNWGEWLEYSQKLHLDTNGDGKIDIYGSLVSLGKNSRLTYFVYDSMWATGKSMFDKDLNCQFNSPNGVQALEFLKQLEEFSPPGNVTYGWYDTIDVFTAGKAAWLSYTGRPLGAVARDNPSLLPHIKAILYPKGPQLRAWFIGYNSFCITRDTRYPDTAKDFAKFLITGERCIDFCLTTPGHNIPPLKSLRNHPKLLNHPLLKKFPETTKVLMAAAGEGGIPLVKEAGAIVDTKIVPGRLNPYQTALSREQIFASVVQKYILEGMPVEEVLQWAEERIKKIVEKVETRRK